MKNIYGMIEWWAVIKTAYDDVKNKEHCLVMVIQDTDREQHRIFLPLIQKEALIEIMRQINNTLEGKKLTRGKWASEKVEAEFEKLKEERSRYIG